jgi:nicotinate-nucleotide adenylyltransferase
MMRIGILGGTFDPVHLGHLIPAQYACHHLRLDRLLLVPSAVPVHRPRHTPASPEDRLRMCRLAAASIPPFSVSDVEVARPDPSYTVLTLRQFRREFGRDADLCLLVGEDNLPLLHTWRHIEEILELAHLAILPRPVEKPMDLGEVREALGEAVVQRLLGSRVPSPYVPISATQIRAAVHAGRSIAGLVPESVATYIAEAGLYADPPPSP